MHAFPELSFRAMCQRRTNRSLTEEKTAEEKRRRKNFFVRLLLTTFSVRSRTGRLVNCLSVCVHCCLSSETERHWIKKRKEMRRAREIEKPRQTCNTRLWKVSPVVCTHVYLSYTFLIFFSLSSFFPYWSALHIFPCTPSLSFDSC